MKIGIIAQTHSDYTFGVKSNYLSFIQNFGNPVIILPVPPKNFFEIYQIDAMVLPGGADIDPSKYSDKISFFTGNQNPYLEYFDNKILPTIIGKIPIFGICRGLQALNVHFGGTLKQHLWGHPFSSYETHTTHKIDIWRNGVKPEWDKNKKGGLEVNSFHHQGIDELANNFRIEAVSDDGVIEAISDYEKKIFAVQWHPERLKDIYSINKFESILK